MSLQAAFDEFGSRLMDGVPIPSKLLPFQLARVSRLRSDFLCGPLAGADGVADVPLGDIGVGSTGGHCGVGIDVGSADAVGFR